MKISLKERLFILHEAFRIIEDYSIFFAIRKRPDLEILYKKYVDAVSHATDRYDFTLLMSGALASLQNGHSNYYDKKIWKNYGAPIPFYAAYNDLARKWVVMYSSHKKLRNGNVITKVEGDKTEVFFQKHRKYISASSDRAARNSLFSYSILFPQKFTIQVNESRTIKIARTRTRSKKHQLSETAGRMAAKEVGYIRIPSFGKPRYEKSAVSLVKKFRDHKAIIIDVRNNMGGTTPLKLIASLSNRPWKRPAYSWIAPKAPIKGEKSRAEIKYGHTFTEKVSKLHKPLKGAYKGRLLILTNESTMSAAEDFIIPLKVNKRATLIGTRTSGTNGDSYTLSLKDGIHISIGVVAVRFPNGAKFEGVGLKPDIEVRPSLEDIKKGVDVVFEKAVKIAQNL